MKGSRILSGESDESNTSSFVSVQEAVAQGVFPNSKTRNKEKNNAVDTHISPIHENSSDTETNSEQEVFVLLKQVSRLEQKQPGLANQKIQGEKIRNEELQSKIHLSNSDRNLGLLQNDLT